MRFEQWKKEILGLNEYEEALLKLVTRQWICEETGSRVCTGGGGLLGDNGTHVWVKKPNKDASESFVDLLEPAELELVAKVKRALAAWVNGETDEIVVDAPEVPPVE